MAPKKSESKKKVSEPVPEVSPEPKEEDPITLVSIPTEASRMFKGYAIPRMRKHISMIVIAVHSQLRQSPI